VAFQRADDRCRRRGVGALDDSRIGSLEETHVDLAPAATTA
jgi:hypothetical protein